MKCLHSSVKYLLAGGFFVQISALKVLPPNRNMSVIKKRNHEMLLLSIQLHTCNLKLVLPHTRAQYSRGWEQWGGKGGSAQHTAGAMELCLPCWTAQERQGLEEELLWLPGTSPCLAKLR